MDDYKICTFCGEQVSQTAVTCRFCGYSFEDSQTGTFSPDIQVRNALSQKYDIIEVIGRGGMATVYKANQKNLNRIVALKVVHPNLVHDAEFLNRFHREAQLAASLNHPNIVMIYDVGSINGVHFISMEYLDGEDLQSLIKRSGKLSVDDTIHIVAPIAEALDYAHQRGLVHRDVKSANIIITKNRRPVLTDFGIAHASSGTKITIAGTVIGTPEYMSPEQAEGREIDGRSDIFSLGVVMFECLTGLVPFKGDNPLTTIHGIIYEATPSIKKFNARIPLWLAEIITNVLSKTPEERLPNGLILSVCLNERRNPSTSFKKGPWNSSGKFISRRLASIKADPKKVIITLIVVFGITITVSTVLYVFRFRQPKQADNAFPLEYTTQNAALISSGDVNKIVDDAEKLFSEGNYEAARQKYQQALSADQNNQILADKIEEINSLLLKRSEIESLFESGDRLFEEELYQEAKEEYVKIISLDANNEKANSRIKIINENLNKLAKTRGEKTFQSYVNIADSLYAIGQYDAAKEYYQKAYQIKPGDSYVQSRLSDLSTDIAINDSEFDDLVGDARKNISAGKIQLAREQLSKAENLKPGKQLIQQTLDSLNLISQRLVNDEINNNMVYVIKLLFIVFSSNIKNFPRSLFKIIFSNLFCP